MEEAAVRYRYYIAVFGGVQACSWVVRHQITFVLRRSIPVIAFFVLEFSDCFLNELEIVAWLCSQDIRIYFVVTGFGLICL